MQARMLSSDERGQMAVELAVVIPIIMIVMVIVIDMMVFASECARFDQLAPQKVIALASSPGRDGYDASSRASAVQNALAADFGKRGSSVSVSTEDASMPLASMTIYHCTFKFAPWPLSVADAPATIEHTCSFAIDPYTPGELL